MKCRKKNPEEDRHEKPRFRNPVVLAMKRLTLMTMRKMTTAALKTFFSSPRRDLAALVPETKRACNSPLSLSPFLSLSLSLSLSRSLSLSLSLSLSSFLSKLSGTLK